MTEYDLVRKEFEELFARSDCANPYDREKDPKHSEITLQWVLKLKPDSEDALKIAALGHDIDRAIESRRVKKENYDNYEEYKSQHANESAIIVVEILKNYKFEQPFITKVKDIIENHEVGGSEDADILKEADSLTFFSWDIYFYIRDKGVKGTEKKIKFMFQRLSEKAKNMVKQIQYKTKTIEDLVKKAIAES